MDENGVKGLEEERRLAYVGITRAKHRAYISFAANRRMYGNWINAIPSRFVDELPKDHVEVSADTGLYQGRSRHWDSSGIKGAAAKTREIDTDDPPRFKRGDRVFHDKFGYGEIVNLEGHKLDINFDHGGLKRVLDSFVNKG